MELIIVGDESKMQENFTRVMFDIMLDRIKEGKLDIKSISETSKDSDQKSA